MRNLIHTLLREGLTKTGGPEEIAELLEMLPVDETARYLTSEILTDMNNFYENDTPLKDKTYVYHPEERCLKPYELNIQFNHSNNYTAIGYASQNHIQIKYLNKDSSEYEMAGGGTKRLERRLFNIIKHECSHFYLRQRDVEDCMYNIHPDGMQKYYHDRQELVLHSREIFDDFVKDWPNWARIPLNKIKSIITKKVKDLPHHTNIHAPFDAGVRRQYINFIMKRYVKPNHTGPNEMDKTISAIRTLGDVRITVLDKPTNDNPDWEVGANFNDGMHIVASYDESGYNLMWGRRGEEMKFEDFISAETLIAHIKNIYN